MSENDIIAEYIREMHPYMLNSVDFAIYKMGVTLRKIVESITETVKNTDFTTLKEAVDEVEGKE